MTRRPVSYELDGTLCEGMLVAPGGGGAPGVLIFPTVMGRSALEIGFAERLAELGYAAMVADLYGVAKIGSSREECRAEMDALRADRARLAGHLTTVLGVFRAQPEVEAARIAATGYCFGGLCVLDLARTGVDIKGAASFHGLFTPPDHETAPLIPAKIVAYHGWDDPLVPPAQVVALASELTEKGADWQIHAYGHVAHGFTNPAAADPERGVVHNETAARRSWAALEDFLAECLA